MRQRPRHASTRRFGTSELEKHQGVSMLLLSGAAISLPTVDLPQAPAGIGATAGPAGCRARTGLRAVCRRCVIRQQRWLRQVTWPRARLASGGSRVGLLASGPGRDLRAAGGYRPGRLHPTAGLRAAKPPARPAAASTASPRSTTILGVEPNIQCGQPCLECGAQFGDSRRAGLQPGVERRLSRRPGIVTAVARSERAGRRQRRRCGRARSSPAAGVQRAGEGHAPTNHAGVSGSNGGVLLGKG